MEDFTVPHICRELKYEWFKQSDIDRFCSHIITPNWQDNPDICWETNYCEDKNGYPIFQFKRLPYRLNRVAYCIANKCGMPIDKVIMHSCNNPKCINPKHLSLGTHKENVQYMMNCNRTAKGQNNGGSIYTEDQIWDLFIRIYNNEFESMNTIRYCGIISLPVLSKILNGILWKDLTTKFCYEYNISLSDLKSRCCNPSPRLSDDIIRQIRADDYLSLCQLSKKYGIGMTTARKIRLRLSYKHVK